MKENLKRLLSGFISSLMVMSFVLMPIPNVSVVYAEDANVGTDGLPCPTEDDYKKGAVYKAGCEFSGTLTTTRLESDADYNKGTVGKFISQYIVGLMGVILLNSLNWSRLSKYNPLVYGNDCAESFGPKWSLPASQVAGLLYLIGDIQSNIKFQAAAKQAAEEYDMELTDLQAYTAKAKEFVVSKEAGDDASDEEKNALAEKANSAIAANTAQEKGYDALKRVLVGQRRAIKTKRNLATASAIGYGIADVVEIVNMVSMHNICIDQWALKVGETGKTAAELTAAITTTASSAATPVTAVPCAAAETAISTAEGISKSNESANSILGSAYGKAKAIEASTASKETVQILSKISEFFSKIGDKVSTAVSSASKAVSSVIDLGSEAKDALAEGSDMAARASKDIADIGRISTLSVSHSTADKIADACVPAKMVKDNYTANFIASVTTRVACCGGPGVNAPTFAFANGYETAASVTNLLAAGKKQIVEAAKQKVKEKVTEVAADKLTKGLGNTLTQITEIKSKMGDNSDKLSLSSGSYWWQGVPKAPGQFSGTRDIKIKNIFEGNVSNFEKRKKLEVIKYYVKNSFESNLRQLAVSGLVKYDMDRPLATLRSIVTVNNKIDGIMVEFDKYLNTELLQMTKTEKVNSNSLAFQRIIQKVKDELFFPKAHAGFGATLVGFGLSTAAGKVDGPWGEVLNVGGKIMMLHGMLGKYAKRYALNRPITRSLTWAGMGLLSNYSRNMANNAIDQVNKNIKIIDTEKQRFIESGANGSGILLTGIGSGELNLKSNETNSNLKKSMNIKQCAVANGDEFLPAPCNQITPLESFQITGLSTSGNLQTNPLGFAHGVMTETAFGSSNSPEYASNLTSGQTANLYAAQKAMADLAEKNRKEYDKIMEGNKAYKDAGGESLQTQIAKLKKVLFKDGITGGSSDSFGGANSAATGDTMASAKPANKLGTGSKVGGESSGGDTAAVAPTVPTFDLDFGDTSTNSGTKAVNGVSKKKEGKLDDYVVKHNDINKRKDVSIFKILSNRYILSYPKVLEEVKQ